MTSAEATPLMDIVEGDITMQKVDPIVVAAVAPSLVALTWPLAPAIGVRVFLALMPRAGEWH